MSEQKPERKVVGRTVAIALGIICIVLVVGLVGAIADYTLAINDKNDTISSLNSQIADKDSQISDLNSQVSNLQNVTSYLAKIPNLEESTIWVNNQTISQHAGDFTSWGFTANYAGYISVSIKNSSSPTTYIRVMYSSHGVDYDSNPACTSIGTNGTRVSPVLPASSITILIGSKIPPGGTGNSTVTTTLSITYHY